MPSNKDVTKSETDKHASDILESTVEFKEGRYHVGLLWKNKPDLPINFTLAFKQLHALVKRLERDPELLEKYTETIDKDLKNNYIEDVPLDKTTPNIWHIPHHPVINPNKAKIRKVLNAASKYHDVSLNNQPMPGPDLMQNLTGVICRFRQKKVAISADIEDMFMQVGVRPKDQKFLRFLWKEGEKIICFQFRRHIFGARCSRTCCNFALRRTAEDNCQQYPSASKAVLRSFYMDDLYHATDTVEEAISISKDLKNLLLLGGFNLTKWSSNSLETMKSIPEEDQNPNDTKEYTILPPIPTFGEKDEQTSTTDTERVLGIQWSVSRDSFVINSKTFKKVDLENPTQRKILKSVSSIYDPIGFIAPFTVRLRTIMQDVWRLGKQWDNLLPTSFDATLKSLMTEIRNISSIEIPRFLFEEKKTPKISTLHIFCDASLTAICAVAYLKTEYTDSTCSINFIMGKIKVAPILQQSIPKL